MEKERHVLAWTITVVLILITGISAVVVHRASRENNIQMARQARVQRRIDRRVARQKRFQERKMHRDIQWNQPSMTIPYPNVSREMTRQAKVLAQAQKKKGAARQSYLSKKLNRDSRHTVWLLVSTKHQRIFVMQGPYPVYTMYASIGKNYHPVARINQTPVGFAHVTRNGGQFFDPQLNQGTSGWLTYSTKQNRGQIKSVPLSQKGQPLKKGLWHFGSTKLSKKHNHRNNGAIYVSVPDAQWLSQNIKPGTQIIVTGYQSDSIAQYWNQF